MKLSEHFTLEELIESPTARRKNIVEQFTPSQAIIENLKDLVINVLEPLRVYIGKPIKVNSGFRCPTVNKTVGGNAASQHLKGQAADIVIEGMPPLELIKKLIESNIVFDQVIEEYGSWTHISFNKRGNRKMKLKKRQGSGYTTLIL